MTVAFCGEQQNATSITTKGPLSNECFLDGLSFLPHIFLVLISLPILIAWNKSYYGSMHIKSWVHFPGHELRWVLSGVLVVLTVAEVGDGLLSNSLYAGTHLHLFLPPATAVVGAAFSAVYYHYVELCNSPRFLLLLAAYWTAVLATKLLELLHLLEVGLGPAAMHFTICCCFIVICSSFLLIELYVLLKLRYALFQRPRKLKAPPELVETTFVQDYVSLISRVTFYWVGRILIAGYKNPLERRDLGNLPPCESSAVNFKRLYSVIQRQKENNLRHCFAEGGGGTTSRGTTPSGADGGDGGGASLGLNGGVDGGRESSGCNNAYGSGAPSGHGWQEEPLPGLWRCYLRTFWGPLVAAGAAKMAGDMLGFLGPFCIRRIVAFVEETRSAQVGPQPDLPQEEQYVEVSSFISHGYTLCLVLFLATVAQNTALQMHHYLVIRQGIRLRSALQVLIYRKALHLTPTTLTSGSMSAGQAANLVSVDVFNVMMSFYMGHYLWALPLQALFYQKVLHLASTRGTKGGIVSAGDLANIISIDTHNLMMVFYTLCHVITLPLQTIITVVLLYQQLGLSALVAVGVLLALCPVQYSLAKLFSRIQKSTLATSDERLRLLSELFTAIKLIKLCAWEKILCGRVEQARTRQLHLLFKGSCLAALTSFITHGTLVLIMLIAFLLYPHLERAPLTAGQAFSSLALFNILALPLHLFPLIANIMVNAVVSTNRVAEFLQLAEVNQHTPLPQDGPTKSKDVQVEISLRTVDPEVKIVNGSGCGSDDSSSHQLSPEQTIMAVKKKGRKRSSASCSEYEESTKTSSLHVCEQKRPRSVGNLLTVNLYDAPYGGKNQQQGGHRVRTMSGSHVMVPKADLKRHSVASVASQHAAKDSADQGPRTLLEIEEGSFSWNWREGKPDLDKINLHLSTGGLSMIVGPVAAGKSSLLAAILGEMCCLSGKVTWHGHVTKAFVGQVPWLLNDSLQNNILFGRPMDKKRYRQVLHACALNPDISILPAGDLTEIGEKGINLSGGQKQRVSLARALYSNVDVVILDDPFSALDAHVGAHIFDAGILRMLLRRRCTVIMATHHLQYLKYAQTIVTLSEGSMTQVDNVEDLKASHPDLYDAHQKAVSTDRMDEGGLRDDGEEREADIDVERRCLQHHMSTREFQRQMSTSQLDITGGSSSRDNSLVSTSPRQVFYAGQMANLSTHDESSGPADHITERRVSHTDVETLPSSAESTPEKLQPELDEKLAEVGRLIEVEERQQGSVSVAVYFAYIKACTVGLALLVIVLQLARSGLHIATDFWLAKWSSASSRAVLWEASLSNLTDSANSTIGNATQDISQVGAAHEAEVTSYIHGYTALALATVCLSLIIAFGAELAGLLASVRLHHSMLHTILYAPMRFFDVTPIGRIINRFSGDVFTIDDKLPTTIDGLFRATLLCVSAMVVNAIATPFFLLFGVPIIIIYYFLQRFYRASSRELARLDSISKSPVVAHFTETLAGLSTIRAYRDTERFQKMALRLIDTNATIFLWLNTCNRWLGIRLDHMGALVVLAAAICTVTIGSQGYISSGLVGLGIAYALMMASYLNWVVRMITDAEMQMNAVERVVHYSKLKTEAYDQGQLRVPESWPQCGAIEFRKVSLRYADTLEPAVRNVTLSISAGQKVGICGRTGSGKSSLTLGLFRLNDLMAGEILIDGIDISRVDLETLRGRLSIIPQDPVLFSGTIRFNLDPLGESTDEELWKALEIAQLKHTIDQLEGQLDAKVEEGGANFSVGQRQLFCLSRAFLRQARILVMDEATASVDMDTDLLIQEVIQSSFAERTVLTIAHRVSTIANSDIIIVLDNGIIIEHDTPQNLLANKESAYYGLIKGNK